MTDKELTNILYYGCDPVDIARDFLEWGLTTREQIAQKIQEDKGGIDPEMIYKHQQFMLKDGEYSD